MRGWLVVARIVLALSAMTLFAVLFVYSLSLVWHCLLAGQIGWALLHVVGSGCWLLLLGVARSLVLPP
jgi:hypothetical protein